MRRLPLSDHFDDRLAATRRLCPFSGRLQHAVRELHGGDDVFASGCANNFAHGAANLADVVPDRFSGRRLPTASGLRQRLLRLQKRSVLGTLRWLHGRFLHCFPNSARCDLRVLQGTVPIRARLQLLFSRVVLANSGHLQPPHRAELHRSPPRGVHGRLPAPDLCADGGTCLVGPDANANDVIPDGRA